MPRVPDIPFNLESDPMTTTRDVVSPAGRHALYELHRYSPAIRSNGFLFVSGQVGSRPDGSPEPDLDGIVRFPGQTYQIRRDRPGEIAVIDGMGGRTIGVANVGPDGDVSWSGEDVATLERVVMAWVDWCLANGKPAWPTK